MNFTLTQQLRADGCGCQFTAEIVDGEHRGDEPHEPFRVIFITNELFDVVAAVPFFNS